MQIVLHKKFVKKYARLTPKVQLQFKERRDLLIEDTSHPLLNNHELQGALSGVRSINITGDYRAHYIKIGDDTILFIDIDTHSNLYGA